MIFRSPLSSPQRVRCAYVLGARGRIVVHLVARRNGLLAG
jgi:hypothetical protein